MDDSSFHHAAFSRLLGFENRLQLRTLGYFFLHEEFCQILQRLPMRPEKIADLYTGLS